MYTGKHWFRQSQQELFKFIFWPLPQSFSNLFPQNFKFLWLRNSFSLICLVSTLNRKIDILNFDVLNHRLLQIFKKKLKPMEKITQDALVFGYDWNLIRTEWGQ